jgi:hypothetical protein
MSFGEVKEKELSEKAQADFRRTKFFSLLQKQLNNFGLFQVAEKYVSKMFFENIKYYAYIYAFKDNNGITNVELWFSVREHFNKWSDSRFFVKNLLSPVFWGKDIGYKKREWAHNVSQFEGEIIDFLNNVKFLTDNIPQSIFDENFIMRF